MATLRYHDTYETSELVETLPCPGFLSNNNPKNHKNTQSIYKKKLIAAPCSAKQNQSQPSASLVEIE